MCGANEAKHKEVKILIPGKEQLAIGNWLAVGGLVIGVGPDPHP